MAKEIYRTAKGVSDIVLTDLDTGRLLVLPAASEVSFNPGVTQQEVMTATAVGEMAVADRYTKEIKPTLKAKFGVNANSELLGMKLGRKFTNGTSTTQQKRRSGFLIEANTMPAATTGLEGFGILADAVSKLSYYDPVTKLSASSTQGTFATFAPGTTLTGFAVGADGAMKFGNDLVGKYATFEIPIASITNVLTLSQAPFTNLSATAVVIDTALEVWHWRFASVTPDITSEISLNNSEVEIPFFVNYSGGCNLLEVTCLGQARSC